MRPDQVQDKVLLGLVLNQEGGKASNRCSCSLVGRVRVRTGGWVGLEGRLRWSTHLFGGTVGTDPGSGLCFCSWHLRRGRWFWHLCILLFMICPNCLCMQLILVPYSFFVSVVSGDVCPGASTAVKCPGPSLSPYYKANLPSICQLQTSFTCVSPRL